MTIKLGALEYKAVSAGEDYPLEEVNVDGYLLTKGIGKGGFASVYGAERDGADFAVKVCDPAANIPRKEAAELFRSEIETQSRLLHPNIVPVLDSGVYLDNTAISFGRRTQREYPYFVMPRADTSLKEVLEKETRSVTPELALEVVGDVARGLDYAHQHDVLHRDVKPANILALDGEPGRRWALADFGIAVTAHNLYTVSTVTRQFLAASKMYSSPEQYLGDAKKPSDVYSLGMVASQICIGDTVYDIDKDVLPAHYRSELVKARLRPFSELVPTMDGILEEMEPVIVRAVDRDPAGRQQSAGEFADALIEAYHRGKTKKEKAAAVLPMAGATPKTLPYPMGRPGDTPVPAPTVGYTDPNELPPHQFHDGYATVPDSLEHLETMPADALSDRKPKSIPRDPVPLEEAGMSISHKRERLAMKWRAARLIALAGIAVGAVLGTVSATTGIGPAKEGVVDFVSDDRAELAKKLTSIDPANDKAFAAALREYVDEEVEQARINKYDTRPLRIMAGDASLVEGYVKDAGDVLEESKSSSGSKPELDPAPVSEFMYTPHLVAAYGGKRTDVISETSRRTGAGTQTQIYYWLGDTAEARSKLTFAQVQSRDNPPDALMGACNETTLGQALLNSDAALAKQATRECYPATAIPKFHLAGRLAVASGDAREVQAVLSSILTLKCEKDYYFGIGNQGRYMLNEAVKSYEFSCTTNEQYASMADIAAYALLFYSRQ